jgi:lysine biosynthesis protein LysW
VPEVSKRLDVERVMATCPVCDADELEVDEYEVDEGDIVNCPECGASLEVTSLAPLEFESAGDDDDDDDDDEDEEDEDGDEDDEDEDEDEDEKGDWDDD